MQTITYEGKEYFVSIREVADYLDIAYSTAYQYIRMGYLPAIAINGTYFVLKSEVEKRKESKGHK